MIQEALEYLAKIQTPQRPVTIDVAGQLYSVNADGTLGRAIGPVDLRYERPSVEVQTLSGLVAAYKAKIDNLGARIALLIEDPFSVLLIDLDVDEFGLRKEYAAAKHVEAKPFPFNAFHQPEPFLLAFRAGFLFNDDAVTVQRICSTISSGSGVAVADDGISREVTVTLGTVTKSAVTLPAEGISLIPWRTFRDANPVEAKFLLRMKGVKDALPQIALFEIDAMWSLYAIASIRKYLQEQLPDAVIIA